MLQKTKAATKKEYHTLKEAKKCCRYKNTGKTIQGILLKNIK